MITKRMKVLFGAFFIAVAATLCFLAFGCSSGNNGGDGGNGDNENQTDYLLDGLVCRVDGLEDVYVDINDMAASDHATYDAVILLYGKTVKISDDKIRFVDGTSFMALGEMDYIMIGDKMMIANEAVSAVFNDIRLKDGIFSFGIVMGGVSYSFEYYAPYATVPTFTVSFDAAGGTCTVDSVTVRKWKKVGALPTPKFGNLEFAGWYDKKFDGTEWTADTVFDESADKVLYAHWRTTLTLDCDGLGGVGGAAAKTKNISVQYGKSIGVLDKASESHSSVQFLGWYTEHSAGGKKVNDNQTFLFEGPTTLYAAWRITLNFNAYGGTVSTDSKTFTYGKPIGDLPTPTKKGNVFGGWFTGIAGSGKEYNANTVFSGDDLPYGASMKVYAKWIYKVNFDYQGATSGNEAADMNVAYNSTIDYKSYSAAPKPYKDGYSFEGWFLQKNGRGCKLTSSYGLRDESTHTRHERWDFDGDITLYAYWVKGTDKRNFSYSISNYGFTNEKQVVITGLLNKTLTEIEIPGIIDGVDLVFIKEYAFAETNLTKADLRKAYYRNSAGYYEGCLYGCPLTELKVGSDFADRWDILFKNRNNTATVVPSPLTVNGTLYDSSATTGA